jgi:hypothetical protein
MLIDLPTELITSICGSLDHADILSLRHSSRHLTVSSADAYEDAPLDSITVTSSAAGLERLERLLTLPDKAKKTKHVTLHVLTPWGLKELADTFENGKKNPYLLAYAKVRTALLNGLNALPNLDSITITNGKFKDITEPAFPLEDEPRFDPICEVDRKTQGDRLTPRIYAFKSTLSLLPSLTNQFSLHLTIDYANLDPDLTRWDGWGYASPRPFIVDSIAESMRPKLPVSRSRRRTIGCKNAAWPCMVPVQEHMFGTHDFGAQEVVEKYVRHAALRGTGAQQLGLFELLGRIADDRTELLSLTFEDVVVDYERIMRLTTLRLTNMAFSQKLNNFFISQPVLASIEMTRCHGPLAAWNGMANFWSSTGSRCRMLRHFCIQDCTDEDPVTLIRGLFLEDSSTDEYGVDLMTFECIHGLDRDVDSNS